MTVYEFCSAGLTGRGGHSELAHLDEVRDVQRVFVSLRREALYSFLLRSAAPKKESSIVISECSCVAGMVCDTER